nr:hypothetical protein [Tanacetum cinerariifolium]
MLPSKTLRCTGCMSKLLFSMERLKKRAPRSQDTKYKESTKRSVPMEILTSTSLVSCDGLGGYDWSDKAEKGPNYALMAYTSTSSDSKVSTDSTCKKSCLETIKILKSQKEQLIKDLKKSELMVLGYKSGLESVEERLKFFKTNCRKRQERVRYENYNAVPPPYTGNFMPPKPELSFTGLDEFANKPVVENCDAKTSETKPKDVRKNNDALILEEWLLDDDEEEVTQPNIEQKIVKPSIPKIEFVKPK